MLSLESVKLLEKPTRNKPYWQPFCLQSFNFCRLLGDALMIVRHGNVSEGFPIFLAVLQPNEPERNPERSTGVLQEESCPLPPLPQKKSMFTPEPASKVRGQPHASVIETGTMNDFCFHLLLKFWKTCMRLTACSSWVQRLGRGQESLHRRFLDQQFPQDPLWA